MLKGIGIGFVLSGILTGISSMATTSDYDVEKEAYDKGMIYESECKVTFEEVDEDTEEDTDKK